MAFDLHPFTLLVSVLVLLVLQKIIGAVGQKNIENAAWRYYCKVAPVFGHSKLSTISQKTAEARDINRQRKAISAQDQYAKWTKLNRQFDKLNAEIETLNGQLSQERAFVVKTVGQLIKVLTVMPLWFCRFWFRKTVLFHLPPGVLPYPIERLFAAPFVVLGGVGLTVWIFSVNSVVSSIVFLIKFPFEEKVPEPQKRVEEVKDTTVKAK